jgi:hypothetical protein
VQSKRDNRVNSIREVKMAKKKWDQARIARTAGLKKSDVIKKGLFDSVLMAKKAYDIVLDVKRKEHKLSKRIIDLEMKMEYEVKKARDATAFFLSQFKHVLESRRERRMSLPSTGNQRVR